MQPVLKTIAALALAVIGTTQAATATGDEMLRDMSCTFARGTSWTVEGGRLQSAPPQSLSFSVTAINLTAQSAKLTAGGTSGTGTLRIIRALNANHFLEVAQEGFLNLTTIYDRDPASGTHPAVHSRHFALLGQPLFSQYAGSCTEK